MQSLYRACVFTLVLLALLSGRSEAAISVVDSEDPVSSGGVQTITKSLTVTANDLVIAYVAVADAANPTATWDGGAMTAIGTSTSYFFGTRKIRAFVAVAGGTGTFNAVMDYGSAATFFGGAFAISGGTASTTLDNSTTGFTDSGATTKTATLTPVADNAWMFVVADAIGGAPAAGTGSTAIGTPANSMGAFSNGPITPAAATNMEYTMAASGTGFVAFTVAPSGGGGGSTPKGLMMLGVGE